MGKINKTYDVTFKKRAVDHYLKDGMKYDSVTKELGISSSMKLVMNIIKKAKKRRNVKGFPLHSDQGFQYTSR